MYDLCTRIFYKYVDYRLLPLFCIVDERVNEIAFLLFPEVLDSLHGAL